MKENHENPILALRKAKGWSRTEMSNKTGLNYQTVRALEIGSTKKISEKTLEGLSFVGIGEDIQKKLDNWHKEQNEERKSTMLKEKDSQSISQAKSKSGFVDSDQVLVNKPQTKIPSEKPTGGQNNE